MAETNLRHLHHAVKRGFDGMSIYVCSDALSFFVSHILSHLSHRFTLVSGDSDLCVPLEALTAAQTCRLLNHPLLIRWFAQNTRFVHPKMEPLPIGLDYHTLATQTNSHWGPQMEPWVQERMLMSIRDNAPPQRHVNKVLAHFSMSSDRFKQRVDCLEQIHPLLVDVCRDTMTRENVWKQMVRYWFVLSPFGIGMDCHRTWEALALGCIPILCQANPQLFEGLPVIMVDKWSDVTQEMLENRAPQVKTQIQPKQWLSYWKQKICG